MSLVYIHISNTDKSFFFFDSRANIFTVYTYITPVISNWQKSSYLLRYSVHLAIYSSVCSYAVGRKTILSHPQSPAFAFTYWRVEMVYNEKKCLHLEKYHSAFSLYLSGENKKRKKKEREKYLRFSKAFQKLTKGSQRDHFTGEWLVQRRVPCIQEGSILGLMFSCYYLEILKNFWTRDPRFYIALDLQIM